MSQRVEPAPKGPSRKQRRLQQPQPALVAPQHSYRWVARHRVRKAMAVCLILTIALALTGGGLALTHNSRATLGLAGLAAACAVVLYAGLQVTHPKVISVEGSTIEFRQGDHLESFDLTDPAVEIRVRDGEISFMHYDSGWKTVRSADVDWNVFTDVVMYYQNHADRKAQERVDRFLR